MQVSTKSVTISQLTGDGSRPSQSQIIAALFPPMPAYYSRLFEDWTSEFKQQVAGLVAPLMGWNPEPKRVLLVRRVGSGTTALLHSVCKLTEARCLRILLTADMFASDLDRLFAQVEQEERLLVIIEDCDDRPAQHGRSLSANRLGQHLDRLCGRNNTVVVVATTDVANLRKELADRFGDVKIDMTSPGRS
jgi:kynureninase